MTPCLCPGCDRPAVSRGRCVAHYQSWRRSSLYTPKPGRQPRGAGRLTCTHDGCDRPQSAKGLCARHYWAARYPLFPSTRKRVKRLACTEEKTP